MSSQVSPHRLDRQPWLALTILLLVLPSWSASSPAAAQSFLDLTREGDPEPVPITELTPSHEEARAPIAGGLVATLTLDESDGRPLVVQDHANRLSSPGDSVLSFWARAEWDDAHCDALEQKYGAAWPEWKYVHAQGTSQSSRFEVALSCDRRRLLLHGAEGVDEAWLPAPLQNGEAHHFVLHSDEHGTLVTIDGEQAASLPITPAKVRRLPLFIGDSPRGDERFIGTVAALRIWTGDVDLDVVEELSTQPARAILASRHAEHLVAYLQGGPDEAPSLTIVPMGTWVLEAVQGAPQRPKGLVQEWDRSMQPHPVFSLVWTTGGSELSRGAHQGIPGIGPPSVEADELLLGVWESVLGQEPVLHLYRQADPRTFRRVDDGALLRIERDGALNIDGRHLVRPEIELRDLDFADKWGGGGGPANMDFNSAAYDIRSLDLTAMNTGTEGRSVFALTYDEVGRAWTTRNGMGLPVALQLREDIRADGERTLKQVRSTQALTEIQTMNWGIAKGYAKVNRGLQNQVRRASKRSETLLRGEARCEQYSLSLDPSRAPLSDSFRRQVETLRRDGLRDACEDRVGAVCRDALTSFVNAVGTHYANSVTYGGRAIMEQTIDSQTSSLLESTRKSWGIDAFKEVQSQFGIPGASVTVNTTLGFRFGMMTQADAEATESWVRDNLRWQAYGGVAGSNFDNWHCERSGAVPVFIDLELISSLLAPPFFTDHATVLQLRSALETYLQEVVLMNESWEDRVWFEPTILPKFEPPRASNRRWKVEPDDVECHVWWPGQGLLGPSDSFLFTVTGTRNEICIPVGNDLRCGAYFGKCQVASTGETVVLRAWNDNGPRTGFSDTTRFLADSRGHPSTKRGCVRIGDDEPCGKWLGDGRTNAGRAVRVSVFNDGQRDLAGPLDAINMAGSQKPCVAGHESGEGNCRRWFGLFETLTGSATVEIQTAFHSRLKYRGFLLHDEDPPSRFRLVYLEQPRDPRVARVKILAEKINRRGKNTWDWLRVDRNRTQWHVRGSRTPHEEFVLKLENGYSVIETSDGYRLYALPSGEIAADSSSKPKDKAASWGHFVLHPK
ncbi:MAG: MAC/perforin domain-containing protein [Acidobacteriota bacterium]